LDTHPLVREYYGEQLRSQLTEAWKECNRRLFDYYRTLAARTFEALEAIREAEGLVERFEERLWRADLHRLRSVLLTAIGADETQIEASFCESIRAAKEQKSISLAKRAEASYAEYHSRKGKL
jgi:hypothetical protein